MKRNLKKETGTKYNIQPLKYIIFNIIPEVLFTSMILFGLLACKEDEWPVDKSYERMFRPHTLSLKEVTPTSAALLFPRVSGTDKYIIELSTDSLLFNEIFQTIEIPASETDKSSPDITLFLNNLSDSTLYSARVKVTSEKGILDSEYSQLAFRTPIEQILSTKDLKYTSVTLKWTAGATVTHLYFSADGGTSQKIDLTDEEKAAGTKSFTGLDQGVKYNAAIYNGDATRRGFASVTTPKLDLPAHDLVIYLENQTLLQQETFDTLSKSNVVFVLFANKAYTVPAGLTLKENTSISFVGEPITPKAILSAEFTLPAIAGTIRFKDLDITGFKYENGQLTTNKRNYLFNQSVATETQEVIFEKCTVRNFVNTPFRVQGSNPINIGTLRFNNCVAFDCGVNGANGTYALVHSAAAACKINNIEITNSSIYNIGYGLIVHNASPSASVKVQNCTFDDIIGNGRYLIDYNAQTVGTFSLTNCILGKAKSPLGTARGIRIAGTTATATLSYKTSDFIAIGGGFEIGGLISYDKASTDLFTNPGSGDFTIKDPSFEGKSAAGDPKWKK